MYVCQSRCRCMRCMCVYVSMPPPRITYHKCPTSRKLPSRWLHAQPLDHVFSLLLSTRCFSKCLFQYIIASWQDKLTVKRWTSRAFWYNRSHNRFLNRATQLTTMSSQTYQNAYPKTWAAWNTSVTWNASHVTVPTQLSKLTRQTDSEKVDI